MTERVLSSRYRTERRIGSGGMAVVYAGLDTVLRRRVAIKMLRAQFAADTDFVKRFYFEAQHAAKLSHPNIVGVYDVCHEGEEYFIVMELVDGSALGEMIEHEGRLPEAAAVEYATQICAGLSYAHRNGLLHRDVKPANILITSDDVVKLSDFGIARAVTSQTVTITQPGVVMGSVFYLSPEQAQGHELEATSDLYSLGVVLYQMLSGKLPYTGDSPVTVALKHVSNPVPALDAEELGISPALAAIVFRLMQKDPADRYASAADVAHALRATRDQPAAAYAFAGASAEVADAPIPRPKPRPSRSPDYSASAGATAALARGSHFEEAAPSGNGRRVWVALLVLALAAAAAYFVFGGGRNLAGLFGSAPPVSVADVVGRRLDDAEQALQRAGFQYAVTYVTSETVPKDRIVRQDPDASHSAKRNSTVQLFVSSGLPLVQLIDLRRYSADDAQRYLRDARLVPRVQGRYDDKDPKDTVISQSPAPNAQIPIRSTVSLVVSLGARPVGVPDLVSRPLGDATEAASKLGLRVEVGDRVSSDNIEPDLVASQNPAAGTQVPPGTAITVVVSTGPASIQLPDVTGTDVAAAGSTLRAAGLAVSIEYVVDASSTVGSVLQQSPSGGTQVKKGSPVTLSVAVPGAVPEVTGMALEDARAALQSAGYGVAADYGAEGDPGKVVGSDPPPGTSLRPGVTVTLHVAGPAP